MALKKVLIVEDSEMQAQMYKIIFAKYKSEIIFAENGTQALELLKQHPDVQLVISDIEMPKMDGLAFLKLFKTHQLVDCPIILISTKDNMAKIEIAKKLGADATVIKPWNMAKLQELIQSLVPVWNIP